MTEEAAAGAEFDEADIRSVAVKLASLDLTDGEMAALVALINDDDEVIGHALGFDVRSSFRTELSGLRDNKGLRGVRKRGLREF